MIKKTALAVAILLPGMAGIVQAQAPLAVEVRIVGDQGVGSTIDVEIVLLESRDLLGGSFKLVYDPALLEPDSPPWALGPSFHWPGESLLQVDNQAQQEASLEWTVYYQIVDINADTAPPRPPGVFARARFTVVGTGTFAFYFLDDGPSFGESPSGTWFQGSVASMPVFDNTSVAPPLSPSSEPGDDGGGAGGGCRSGGEPGTLAPLLVAVAIFAARRILGR